MDSTFLSEAVRGHPGALESLATWEKAGDSVFTTSINGFEVALGIALVSSKARQGEMREAWHRFLGAIPVLPLDERAAELAAGRQAELRREGRTASVNDLFVSAIAAANGCDEMVTADRTDFQRIGLVKIADR